LGLALSAGHAAAATLLLEHGTLVDPAKHTAVVTDLLLTDGRISFPAPGTTVAADRVVDLAGKWILPGLIDLHVHTWGNALPDGRDLELGVRRSARAMLYAGVVACLDLATDDPASLFGERQLQRDGKPEALDEADVYAAGTPFGAWNLTSAASARKAVRAYVAKWHPDVVKLIYEGGPDVPHAGFAAAIQTAHELSVKTVVHIGPWANAGRAIRAGATAITHFEDGAPIPDDLVQTWKAHATLSIPTMAVQGDLANFVAHPELLASPLLTALVGPDALRSYADASKYSDKAKYWLSWQTEDAANDQRTFTKLQAAGIVFLAGSDTNNLGTFQGFSLHREIALMRDAGLPAWDALAAATTLAAAFLGRPSGIGAGELAELVVIDGDPVVSVANTQRLSAVVHRGRWIDRSKLLLDH
jgi:hypothetical protein